VPVLGLRPILWPLCLRNHEGPERGQFHRFRRASRQSVISFSTSSTSAEELGYAIILTFW